MSYTRHHVDLSHLYEASLGDNDFVKEMIDLFIARGQTKLNEIESQISDGQNEQWVSVTHALKGMAANIGASILRDLCAKAQLMETATKSERQHIFDQIKLEYQAIVKELENTSLSPD